MNRRKYEKRRKSDRELYYDCGVGVLIIVFFSTLPFLVRKFIVSPDEDSLLSYIICRVFDVICICYVLLATIILVDSIWNLFLNAKARKKQAEFEKEKERISIEQERRNQEWQAEKEQARHQAAERKRREEAEKARIKAENERIQSKERKTEELAKRKAIEAKRQAWEKAPKHRRCTQDNFIYPHFLFAQCPLCGKSDGQEEIRAEVDEVARKPQCTTNDERIEWDSIDFLKLGNQVLRVLMERDQESKPTQNAETIAKHLPDVVARQFSISPKLTFAVPHSDTFLPGKLRDRWGEDVFPRTIIFAYVLGATWTALPPPHEQLYSYYRFMADRQYAIIKSLAREWAEAHRQRRKADLDAECEEEIARTIDVARKKGKSQPEIDYEVDCIKKDYASKK